MAAAGDVVSSAGGAIPSCTMAAVINSNSRRRELLLTIGANGAAVITFLNEWGNPLFCVRVGNSSSNRNAIPSPFVFVPRGVEDSMQRLILETRTLYVNHSMICADGSSGEVVVVIPRSPFFLVVCCSALGLDAVPIFGRLPKDYFLSIVEVRPLIENCGGHGLLVQERR